MDGARILRSPSLLVMVGSLAVGSLSGAAAGTGSVPARTVRALALPAGPGCSGPGWVVRDDGTPENGLGWDPAVVSDGVYVDRFNLGSAGSEVITRVCMRLARTGGDDSLDCLSGWIPPAAPCSSRP